jgi:ABC-type transport system involved in cytochrome bd biosynthesis fused ATPase/permease subunit
LDGELSFHGSAVAVPAGCVAFLGRSGAGKSTLAAAFLHGAHAVADAVLVGDDVVHVDREDATYRLLPGGESHMLDEASCRALRLSFDEALEKTAIAATQAIHATPLRAIVVLDWGHELNVQRPEGTQLLGSLLTHVARLVVDDSVLLLAELDQLKQLVAQVPVYVVTRPKQFGALPELIATLRPLFASEHTR